VELGIKLAIIATLLHLLSVAISKQDGGIRKRGKFTKC